MSHSPPLRGVWPKAEGESPIGSNRREIGSNRPTVLAAGCTSKPVFRQASGVGRLSRNPASSARSPRTLEGWDAPPSQNRPARVMAEEPKNERGKPLATPSREKNGNGHRLGWLLGKNSQTEKVRVSGAKFSTEVKRKV